MIYPRRWISALAGLCLVAPCVHAQEADTTTPVPRSAEGWWTKRHEEKLAQAKEQKDQIGVIFLGDSITQGWEGGAARPTWDRFYGPRKPIDLGFSGDRTQHVLWRLDNGEVGGLKPKVAVLMIGTNNAGSNTAEAIADGIKAVVAKIQAKLPETKVLLLAVFPRGETPDNPLREKLKKVNDLIKPLDDGKNVTYLDIGPKFLQEDGTISKEIMPDFLHLSGKGYRIWADAIEPTLWKMMEN
ncbi:MAG: platelet-activating factor acetylhydrolase IB subunit [Isosphaeraceae bacterium]